MNNDKHTARHPSLASQARVRYCRCQLVATTGERVRERGLHRFNNYRNLVRVGSGFANERARPHASPTLLGVEADFDVSSAYAVDDLVLIVGRVDAEGFNADRNLFSTHWVESRLLRQCVLEIEQVVVGLRDAGAAREHG
jgi:hypothetical protein